MKSPLTALQVKSLLTRADLEKLEQQIASNELQAEVVNGEAVLPFKQDMIRLFDVLELIGTL